VILVMKMSSPHDSRYFTTTNIIIILYFMMFSCTIPTGTGDFCGGVESFRIPMFYLTKRSLSKIAV
jgi:hypothetical protein